MPLSSIEVVNKAVKLIILKYQIQALVLMLAACHGDKFIGIDVGHCQMHNNNCVIEWIIDCEF